MNKKNDNIFTATLLCIQVLICVVTLICVLVQEKKTDDHTRDVLVQQAQAISAQNMQERVDNIISYIELERENAQQEVEALGSFIAHSLSHVQYEEMERHLNEWIPGISNTDYGKALRVYLEDSASGNVTLYSRGHKTDATEEFSGGVPAELTYGPYYYVDTIGGATLYVCASWADIDEIVKAYIYDIIHTSEYSGSEYIWVNEILDYQGGDDYAVRRIHPRLKTTEGRHLSTAEADAYGNLPRQEELDQINETGEAEYTHAFLGRDDHDSGGKSVYAKLYKPFDWVVATSEPVVAAYAYADMMSEYSREVRTGMIWSMVAVLVAAFAIDMVIVYLSNKRYSQNVKQDFEKKQQENDRYFDIVAQHSDRILCYYDIATRSTTPWNESSCENCEYTHICFKEYGLDKFEDSKFVLPESREDAIQMVKDIHEGIPYGSANLHVLMPDSTHRWLEFKYSGLYEGEIPVATMISYEDITERHEHELAYKRHIQSMELEGDGCLLYVESDLTSDRIEMVSGRLMRDVAGEETFTHAGFVGFIRDNLLTYEEAEEESRHYSRENLLSLYRKGEKLLESQWKVFFKDGSEHWLEERTTLLADPYTGHIKAFYMAEDITEDFLEQQSLLQRADYDTATGLLRKGPGEEAIRAAIKETRERGGVLVALDLDDLKGINDTLGHVHGDKAISGIARTLIEHFRKDDIIVRSGGDEFMVFLLGAGESREALEVSLTSLLRKLSTITVGDNGERSIHCSVGCAVEKMGVDSFESIYRKADLALYHVKRSGKNNFAFYEPEMEQKDYEFRARRLLSDSIGKQTESPEMKSLFGSIAKYYQLVMSMNLSNNTYHMMEEVRDGVFAGLPAFGLMSEFVDLAGRNVHPDDREEYYGLLSREGLLEAYRKQTESVRHRFRFMVNGEGKWVECLVLLDKNEAGDICDTTLLRWLEEEEAGRQDSLLMCSHGEGDAAAGAQQGG